MADKKISALTAASTPLAGTEVLPLVQSSATVKVSVANLTAGRDVAGNSFTGGNVKISGNQITPVDTDGNLTVVANGNGRVAIGGVPSSFAWSGIQTEIRNGFRVYDSASSSFGLRVGFSSNKPYLQGYRETVGVVDMILQNTGGNVGVGAAPGGTAKFEVSGAIKATTSFNLPSYTVATLPSASTAGAMIYVSDAGGNGPCMAVSNGSAWKRCDNTSTTVS